MQNEEHSEFFLTQTSLKDLEKDTTCPDRWKALWITKEIQFPSNEDMDKGKYFEWICLGGGAVTGQDVTDLPRTSTGKKTIDQIRIEEQAQRFQELFNHEHPDWLGFTIVESQIELRHDGRKGTIDFLAQDQEGNLWLIDLKLTRDAESTRSEYGWGHDWSELDLVQLIHYRDLYTNVRGVTPRVALLVFDYSPDKLVKFGEIVISKKAQSKKETRFQAAAEVIELYKKNGWTKLPSEKECKGCKIASCPVRFKQPPIERFIINI